MPQLRSGVRRGRRPIAATKNKKEEVIKEVVPLVVVEEENAVKKTTSFRTGQEDTKQVEEGVRVLKEEVGEKQMDENDSGGRSGDNGLGAEEEGSTAPLPERVPFSFCLCL